MVVTCWGGSMDLSEILNEDSLNSAAAASFIPENK